MPTPDWNSTEDWEILILGGERMPGVARVEVDMKGGIDKRKSRGARRSKPRDTGAPCAQVDIELVLLPEDMPEFERRIPILRPRGAKAPMDPISIAHPNARLWGVNNVVIESVGSPMPTTGGYLRIKVRALEWVPTPKAIKKPKEEPKGDGGGGVQPLIDALNELPMSSGAVDENFTSDDQPLGSGF